MVRRTSPALLACLVGLTTFVAEPPPNFSGTWGIQISRAVCKGAGYVPGLGLYGPPDPIVIAQDDKSFTAEEHYVTGRTGAVVHPIIKIVYPLDGRRGPTQMAIRGAPMPYATADGQVTSQWIENTLVSIFEVAVPGETGPRRYEQTLSLNQDGELVDRIRLIGTPHDCTLFYRKRDGS